MPLLVCFVVQLFQIFTQAINSFYDYSNYILGKSWGLLLFVLNVFFLLFVLFVLSHLYLLYLLFLLFLLSFLYLYFFCFLHFCYFSLSFFSFFDFFYVPFITHISLIFLLLLLCSLRRVFGFLLSERTSRVSPDIFSFLTKKENLLKKSWRDTRS